MLNVQPIKPNIYYWFFSKSKMAAALNFYDDFHALFHRISSNGIMGLGEPGLQSVPKKILNDWLNNH